MERFCAAAGAAFLCMAVGAAASAEEAATPSPLVERMDYFVRGGGEWSARNPSYQEGRRAPHTYLYRYEYDMEQHVVRNRVLGVFKTKDGDVPWQFYHTLFAWNPKEEAVEIFQVQINDELGRGFERSADNLYTATITYLRPDGTEYVLKDNVEIEGPDAFTSRTYKPTDDGGWEEIAMMRWTRKRG